jgi:hypothetical protein
MSNEMNGLLSTQLLLNDGYQLGDNCLYKEMPDGYRIEVTGTANDAHTRHFNVYLFKGDAEIGQSVGVPQDNLITEIEALCKILVSKGDA